MPRDHGPAALDGVGLTARSDGESPRIEGYHLHARRCVAGLAVAFACIAGACSSGGESAREARAITEAIPVRVRPDGSIALTAEDRAALGLAVTSVVQGEVPDVSLRYGRVQPLPAQDVRVVSPVAGRIASPPKVSAGQSVHTGELLVEMAPSLAAAERVAAGVQGARLAGDIEATRTELATEEAALARARDLAASSIVSRARLQQTQSQVAATRARLQALERAAGTQARGTKGIIRLTSPADGIVASVSVDAVGASVAQGVVLVRILRPGPRWVDVSCSPADPAGASYEVGPAQQAPASWVPARLRAVGATIADDGMRHDRIEVAGKSAEALAPGQIVAVRVGRGPTRGLVVPETALVPALPEDHVFVEVAANVFRPTPVRVAARFDGMARIASGLNAGDQVVVRGVMALEGERRRPELQQQE